MSALLHWLTSPEWAQIVKALLHTLWQGALIATLLGLALRRSTHPTTRYRCSLAALAAVLVVGLFSWAVLNRSLSGGGKVTSNPAISNTRTFAAPREVAGGAPPIVVTTATPTTAPPAPSPWTAWLALAWVSGAVLMLARGGAQVAGAERLRRSCRPLTDDRVAQLLFEARGAIRLARQVRVAVTDRLTSPAVVGVLVPTLILPLSLVTTLTPEQIRFVLLHELAHIRRGDYLANLFQLFAEALLFFNPAVWWISHQTRREREACCDALAIELSRAPLDYAQTLVRVAENVLNPPPAAAPAFGAKHKSPSSLSERVQRLLVPGYRPALRLTWRAMLTSLLLGGALLALSAVGTRLTVAAILSPQERITQIEKKMTEYGQQPEAMTEPVDPLNAPKVNISGRVRTMDGSPLTPHLYLNVSSIAKASSYATAIAMAKDWSFNIQLPPGNIFVTGEMTNFAPAMIGPFDGRSTNRLENLELVFDRGFNVKVRVVDADSGKPVPGAVAQSQFWLRGVNTSNFRARANLTDANGLALLEHCADLPLQLTLSAPGYEVLEQRFEALKPNQDLRVTVRRGAPVAGVVLDRKTGQSIAGATARVLYQKGAREGRFSWTDPQRLLATTAGDGRFIASQFRQDTTYFLGITAPGYESVVLENVLAGQTNLVARLGPELVVRGRITGNLDALQETYDRSNDRQVSYRIQDNVAGQNSSHGYPARVRIESGVGYFQFTNRLAGEVEVEAGGRTFTRNVDAAVADWLIELTAVPATNPPPVTREVVFRFQPASGVPPRGTVTVEIPVNLEPVHRTAYRREIEIRNGEARAEIPVGGHTFIEPGHMVGYWFRADYGGWEVTNGSGPMLIEIPVVPAGAIFAGARNADGTPAGGLSFSVVELKRSPQRDENSLLDRGSDVSSDQAPRKWVSGPLPLGGTYQIIGWRGNSFCASKPIALTDEKPDAETELQFTAGSTIEGRVLDADGKPLRGAALTGTFSLAEHGFGLKPTYTDEDGRFRLEDTTPGLGQYSLQVQSPGCRAENVPVDFARLPITIRLQRGLKLAGQVVEAGTGFVIPDAEISAWTMDRGLPRQTARTDAEGRFEFNTLGEATYTLHVAGANFVTGYRAEAKAGQTTPLKLEVAPYAGGRLIPKPAAEILRRPSSESPTAGKDTPSSGDDETSLSFRKFKVDPNTFYQGLESIGGLDLSTLVPTSTAGGVAGTGGPGGGAITLPRVSVSSGINGGGGVNNVGGQDGSGLKFVTTTIGLEGVQNAVIKFFAALGVDLRPETGKSIFFADRRGELLVRATAQDLDLIEAAVQTLNLAPPQVSVKVKFVEIRSGDDRVLGFDSYLGSVVSSNSMRAQAAPAITPDSAFPGRIADFSGGAAGILTDPQFRVVLQALERRDNVNVLSDGQVTTLSGRQAQLQIVETKFVMTNINPRALKPPGVSSSNPDDRFQMMTLPCGPILDVIPTVGADGYTVHLRLSASLVEFLGYEDRGKTNLVTVYIDDKKAKVPAPYPKIRTRQLTTEALVWDGQTVVLGGLIADETSPADGKQPATVRKKNLVIFITPTITDPAGNRVHPDEELPAARNSALPQKVR